MELINDHFPNNNQPGKEKLVKIIKDPSSPVFNKPRNLTHFQVFLGWTGGMLLIFVLALVITSAIVKSKIENIPSPTSLIAPQPATPLMLLVESPIDGELIQGDEIIVKGKTLANIPVVFYTETAENSVESDENGNFEGTINLDGGINSLIITAFADNGEEKSQTMNLLYDDQVKGIKTPPGQTVKTSTGKKVIIGNVATASATTLTLDEKTANGKYSVDKSTKIIGSNKKTITLNLLKKNDLAAIVATDSSEATSPGQLKKALKIFVKDASASAQQKRRAIQGVISSVTGNVIILTHQIQTERVFSLMFNELTIIKIKGITAATSADLRPGLRIAAVGDLDASGNLVAKRIHIIPGKATGVFNKYPTAPPSANLTATPTATSTASPSATPTVNLTITPTSSPTATPTEEVPTPTPTI